ncbi:ABC transporter ATP-binding protein [Methanospirillum lacunae]|uniref:Molybdenum ABC transporter ATP-binding protein n=1 Tax=Methanospirillum lacunae TaxID=668570 RepID=A0A2V2N6G7_9EURY|nr:ATP-binding cassette domain-containing protein [Methanospirillum lacunae]PWR74095.1 molybdenum ABC transporter ATP-binding protein [Methanospirillum lacunae]
MSQNKTEYLSTCPPPLFECTNISICRGGTKVLDSLNLVIPNGEHVAILGPNGSGKSTLIKVLMKEIYPVQDEKYHCCKVFGKEQWHVFDLRAHFGIVSNDLQFTFTRSITGKEVMLSGFFSSIGLFNHKVTSEMEKKVYEVARFLNIESHLTRCISDLSSGEARRLIIGRALVHQPQVLILDEPTSSLDLHALHTLRKYLRKIAISGVTIILVTHQIHDIIPEINRIIMMKNGNLFSDGCKDSLLTSTNISQLFDIPITVKEENGYYYASGY